MAYAGGLDFVGGRLSFWNALGAALVRDQFRYFRTVLWIRVGSSFVLLGLHEFSVSVASGDLGYPDLNLLSLLSTFNEHNDSANAPDAVTVSRGFFDI